MAGTETPRPWSGRTDGLPWMYRALVGMLRVVDRRVVYAVMALVVPFYMLFSHQGYLACYRFFRRQMEMGPFKAFCHVYRNHFVFGQIIIDRMVVYAGKPFRCTVDDNEAFARLSAAPEGFVQLSSHVGNFEMAGYSLSSGKPVNSLVFGGEKDTLMAFRERVLSEHNVRLIKAGNDMGHIFAMSAALDRGEIVSMAGDRLLGSAKTLTCEFFGTPAAFPMGPFALAVQKNVPLLALFSMKERGGYRTFVRQLARPAGFEALKTREQMQVMAQLFANELEAVLRRYPDQWFNYYDFWKPIA